MTIDPNWEPPRKDPPKLVKSLKKIGEDLCNPEKAGINLSVGDVFCIGAVIVFLCFAVLTALIFLFV
jgi:hypothetical protein